MYIDYIASNNIDNVGLHIYWNSKFFRYLEEKKIVFTDITIPQIDNFFIEYHSFTKKEKIFIVISSIINFFKKENIIKCRQLRPKDEFELQIKSYLHWKGYEWKQEHDYLMPFFHEIDYGSKRQSNVMEAARYVFDFISKTQDKEKNEIYLDKCIQYVIDVENNNNESKGKNIRIIIKKYLVFFSKIYPTDNNYLAIHIIEKRISCDNDYEVHSAAFYSQKSFEKYLDILKFKDYLVKNANVGKRRINVYLAGAIRGIDEFYNIYTDELDHDVVYENYKRQFKKGDWREEANA